MVEPARFIEKKAVGVSEAKQDCAQAIEESSGDEKSENAKSRPMYIEPVPGPRMHPAEAVVFEQKSWLKPVVRDPSAVVIGPDVPQHQEAERTSEETEGRDVHGLEGLSAQIRQKSSNRRHVLEVDSISAGRCVHKTALGFEIGLVRKPECLDERTKRPKHESF